MASTRFTRDRDSGGIVCIDTAHNFIHKGRHFIATDMVHSTTINWVADLRALTNTTEYHVSIGLVTDVASKLAIYRNPVWTSTGGNLLTNINRSEVHSYTSNFKVYAYPTITTTGTARMLLARIPAGSIQGGLTTGGDVSTRGEFLLKTGNSYQFEVTLASSNNAYIYFDWYEVVES